MGLIKTVTDSFRKNAFALGLVAAGMAAPLMGHAQQGTNDLIKKMREKDKAEMPKHYASGTDSIKALGKKAGVTAIYPDSTVDVDAAANIRMKIDQKNNHAVFVRFNEKTKKDEETKRIILSKRLGRHIGRNYFDHYDAAELSAIMAQGSETKKMKNTYKAAEFWVNDRNALYTSYTANYSSDPSLAGPSVEYGVIIANPITGAFLPRHINKHFTTRMAYRLFAEDPNKLSLNWQRRSPWQRSSGSYEFIPSRGILGFGLETGPSSPFIAGIEGGFDCRGFGFGAGNTILNFANTYSKAYAGLRLFNESMLSVELVGFVGEEDFNNNFYNRINKRAKSAKTSGLELKATLRPGNIYKTSDHKANPRNSIYAAAGYLASNKPASAGSYFEYGLYSALPGTKNDNGFIHIAKRADYMMGGVGVGTNPRSPLVMELEAGVKVHGSNENLATYINPYAQAKVGINARPDKMIAFQAAFITIADKHDDDLNRASNYGKGVNIAVGVQGAMVIRPAFYKKSTP